MRFVNLLYELEHKQQHFKSPSHFGRGPSMPLIQGSKNLTVRPAFRNHLKSGFYFFINL